MEDKEIGRRKKKTRDMIINALVLLLASAAPINEPLNFNRLTLRSGLCKYNDSQFSL